MLLCGRQGKIDRLNQSYAKQAAFGELDQSSVKNVQAVEAL